MHGVKNGKKIGKMSNIVVIDAEVNRKITKTSNKILWNIIFKIVKRYVWF